jgi:hypothetical protein
VAKVGTSIPDRTDLERLQCVAEKNNKYSHLRLDDTESNNMDRCTFRIKFQDVYIFIYVARMWRLLRLKIRILKIKVGCLLSKSCR